MTNSKESEEMAHMVLHILQMCLFGFIGLKVLRWRMRALPFLRWLKLKVKGTMTTSVDEKSNLDRHCLQTYLSPGLHGLLFRVTNEA